MNDRLQRPLRDLRISVTDRCNFRCTYCMPAAVFGEQYRFLPRKDLLTFEEIVRLSRIFVDLGVTKLRLTGGEPLVRTDLERLVAMLAQIHGVEDLTLTTNGSLLAPKAKALKEAGLQRITVSLDSLDDAVFQRMNGKGVSVGQVLAGIEAAETVGLWPIKVNAVVQKGVNDHTLVDLASYFKGTGVIVRFIEYMDVGTLNGWKLDEVVPSDEVVARISSVFPLEPIAPNYPGEVAARYRYVDGTGEIGVIASVTHPFCGDCTRIRLSPEGKLATCLFGSLGLDMRALLRGEASDADIAAFIGKVWRLRADRYSEVRALQTEQPRHRVEMFHIGG